METIDVKRLGLILSIQAEVEGMKADNNTRKQNGESLAYCGYDFQEKAAELNNMSRCPDEHLF